MLHHPIRHIVGMAAVVAASLLPAAPRAAFADPAAKPPATQPAAERPALGDIEIADYCTVLLAPKLKTQLGANDAQREEFSRMNTEMHTRFDNCATTQMPGSPIGISPGLISARIKLQLAEYGRQVRDTLTPEQDQRLVDLFNQGTLQPIQVSASINTDVPRFGPNAGKMYRSTSYDVSYTHFGETAAKENDSEKVPTALATATKTPATPNSNGGSPTHARPRHLKPGARSDNGGSAEPTPVAITDPFALSKVIRLPTKNAVKHMVVSRDGKILITAEDQIIRVWDCTSGNPADVEEMDSQSLHIGAIRAIALSPDGKQLALGGDDKSVRLYALTNYQLTRLDTQISHDSGLWTVAFSPDGKSVISGADDMNVIFWNVENGKLTETSRIKAEGMFGIKYLAVQPNKIVTCTAGTGDVQVIDFSAAQPIVKTSYKVPPAPFSLPMAMSPTDSTLLFGGPQVRLNGPSNRAFATTTKNITCVAWSPDGKYFATGTEDGHLLLWDSSGKIRHDYPRPTRFNEVTFIPASDHSTDLVVAGANEDSEIYLVKVKTQTSTGVK